MKKILAGSRAPLSKVAVGLILGIGALPLAYVHGNPMPLAPNALNIQAGSEILYEVQARVANAAPFSADQETPPIDPTKAFTVGSSCAVAFAGGGGPPLRLGTLDDMVKQTTDYRQGITLKYIKERIHATAVWMMPMFPNNAKFNLPDPGDTAGSPYAVRDYMHISGTLSEKSNATGRDEFSYEEKKLAPSWGDDAFDKLMVEANKQGLKVFPDVALNHFGHNYMFYDYADQMPVRDRIAQNQNLDDLWDYEKTFDAALVHPVILDTPEKLQALVARDPNAKKEYDTFTQKYPQLKDDELVRGFNMWRAMLDVERAKFDPTKPLYLEYAVPGFYRGQNVQPSARLGDNFTNNWQDVKFLFHQEMRGYDTERGDYYQNFVRNREYCFRILNNLVAKGARGFRLDHTTDPDSGMGPNEWKYIVGKVNYYDWVRQGKPANHVPPVYLAEEFVDQAGMNMVSDIMTEGYLGDIKGKPGQIKDTSFIETQIEKDSRFNGREYILRALETHDEKRLFDDTGFDIWSGASFWAIGGASRGTPMILMGQEFGEPWGLSFRRFDYLRSRFPNEANYNPNGDALVDLYGKLNAARMDFRNRALRSDNRYFLRLKNGGGIDQRIFAQARWDKSSGGSTVFTFIKPWETNAVSQDYFLPPDLAGNLSIDDNRQYRLVNILDGDKQVGNCISGSDLKWDFKINMTGPEKIQWLRLELCQ